MFFFVMISTTEVIFYLLDKNNQAMNLIIFALCKRSTRSNL